MKKSISILSETKQGQIRTIFFILKVLALFFSMIPIFNYFAEKMNIDSTISYYILFAYGITLIIVFIVIFFLIFIFNRSEKYKFLQILEMAIFNVAFVFVLLISGANLSNYKFIFLFIIIPYTIEYGMKTGLVISSISTGIIIIMDILIGGTSGVNNSFENDLALFAMFFMVVTTLGYYVRLERSHIKEITEFANIDGLTGAYNHRYFYELINSLYEDSKKNNKQLSLLMIDLDYFKRYNDLCGHNKGDELLKGIAALLKENINPSDILCRYGGDEFCVILPETTQKQASDIANKLRETIYNSDWLGQEYLPGRKMTISVGVSTLNDSNENCNDFIGTADRALYRAKFLRRNKVEVYSSVFDQVAEVDNKISNMAESLKPLKTLIAVINSRDAYTYNHVDRVYNYCNIIANYLKLSAKDKRILLYAAYLHDLGKINISKELLVSDSKLTNEEWEELKKHPSDGADIIRQIDGYEEIVPIVLQHHEKYDGTGYPNGLQGENICYLARILTVADSFDAMTNQRTYQKTKTFDEAFVEIERCKGTHFDPDIAQQFIEALNSF